MSGEPSSTRCPVHYCILSWRATRGFTMDDQHKKIIGYRDPSQSEITGIRLQDLDRIQLMTDRN